jgi:hypothetical protein
MPLHEAEAHLLLQILDLQFVQFRLLDQRGHGGGAPDGDHVEIVVEVAVMITAIEAPPLPARRERDSDQA